ncbi:unnamed protein product [Notodromas monacha]|uniref:Delta-aminolevulinic acid dehydratase n=1 Tax=Notodromas monacha TaxID=399045 RepID=A0A7R9BRJ1_9CRUS|nr:unnamed protein product [Notodromas monacha]CAG0918853.1 unnamed protein product [Notodromas monacha]
MGRREKVKKDGEADDFESDSDEGGAPKVIKNAVDLQRLNELFEYRFGQSKALCHDKPVHIPDQRKEKKFSEPPEFIRNVMGSSAGAGSGEFHIYRHIRRREYARQQHLDSLSEKDRLDEEYQRQLEENQKACEERTAKKREKRLKKKQKQTGKKKKKASTASDASLDDDEDEEEDSDDADDKGETEKEKKKNHRDSESKQTKKSVVQEPVKSQPVSFSNQDEEETGVTAFCVKGTPSPSFASTTTYRNLAALDYVNALLRHDDMNVIVVDWGPLAKGTLLAYPLVMRRSKFVARKIAEMLLSLARQDFIKPWHVHLIGLSLGSNIASMAARILASETGHKVQRISGLDPTFLYNFDCETCIGGVSKADAEFVDILHTNTWFIGVARPVGHVDFYPNGGLLQPGCSILDGTWSLYHSVGVMYSVPTEHRLHSGYAHPLTRSWQEGNVDIDPKKLMLPVFVTDVEDAIEDIDSLPDVKRYGVATLPGVLKDLMSKGLKSVLLFGVLNRIPKDESGSGADGEGSPVVAAIRVLRDKLPDLLVACDVCLCAYTSTGHCGLLNSDGQHDNAASVKRMAAQALVYARAGAHIVAPSSMSDGIVGAIKKELVSAKLDGRVAVLSYAVKFASSCFYGPFRSAAQSAPKGVTISREGYQLPVGSRGLAHRAAARDVEEGADMLMVKPGMAYLDIVRETKDRFPNHPLFIYQVSGEYSMLFHGAENGAFDLEDAVMETFKCMRRAGADVIISYFTPLVLELLNNHRMIEKLGTNHSSSKLL